MDDIGIGVSGDGGFGVKADQSVAECGPDNAVHTRDGVAGCVPARKKAGLEVHVDGCVALRIVEEVETCAAIDGIAARAACDGVVAGPGYQRICAPGT